LDRFELLYDNVDELKDLRRAVIDEDLSSVFRLIGTNTKSRKVFNELRKAVLEKNIHAIFRVIQAIDDSENIDLIRNSVINKGDDIEVLRKTLSLFIKSETLDTLVKTLRTFPESAIKDAFARGQLHSKKWLVSEVENIGMHLGTVFLCAGWYGTLATMLFESKKIHLDKIRSFDIDKSCWKIAESINKPWVMDEWKFKATTQDIHKINFNEHTYKTLRSNGTERELFDKPNTIINTSCEHIENWSDWWDSIPKGKLCILQSNDYKELPEHINCVNDVEHFKSIAPMTTYLYGGELILGKYTRYMLIGIK
jgi:hypothetical protein